MRVVDYQDRAGRKFKVQLPDDAPDSHARYGIPVGPPDLSSLGLPRETEVRLNNQLYNRGILTKKEARRGRQEIFAALQAAFGVDTGRIIDLYEV